MLAMMRTVQNLWTLLKIEMDDILIDETNKAVDDLMGTKPEARFKFIQENAQFADNLDI
jgi:topoisomerase-4 subunit B